MGRNLKEYLVIGFKGMAMGAADVVPGVSGGTIAFISGIYEELLASISNINFKLLKTLKTDGIKAAWKQVNGSFLLALFFGIFISIISLAKTIKWLLENEPILLWSFFFGLVLASIIYIGKQISKWNVKIIILFILGISFGYVVTIMPPTNVGEINYFFLIFAGAIASCAMILPGISGSYILLLLGVYSIVMTAITAKDYKIIGAIAIGVLIGLLSFARLLKWLFLNYKNQMLIVLTGVMLGSLNKVWPWKVAISTYIDSHGVTKPLVEQSILPVSFDGDPKLMSAIVLAIVGFGLILLMEKLAVKKE
ncbi:MAG: putative membrane protein [Polaribacter sp.]|jgi:putative membrane protein